MTFDRIQRLAHQRAQVGDGWGRLNKARLQAVLEFADQSVLDVGCGRGEYIYELRKRGYQVFGFDLLTTDDWLRSEVSYFGRVDASALPVKDESFDTALLFEVLEHLADPQSVLAELHRVVRRSIIVSVPNGTTDPAMRDAGLAFHHWVDQTHVQVFTEQSLNTLLSAQGFWVQEIRFINPIRPEVLVLSSWRLPARAVRLVSRVLANMPGRKRYYMTLLAIAKKQLGKGDCNRLQP